MELQLDATRMSWRESIMKIDERELLCPWRPEPVENPNQLIARRADINNIIEVFKERRVLMLHGETGVGKSSLLKAGLCPQLATQYHVITCSDWSKVGPTNEELPTADFEMLLSTQVLESEKLAPNLYTALLNYPNGFTDALARLARERTGKELLLVLDQFEEFLRKSTAEERNSFKNWVDSVSGKEYSKNIKILFSLRSEFSYRLETLLDVFVSSNRFNKYELKSIQDTDEIKEVILGKKGENKKIIDAEVVNRLGNAWDASKDSQSTTLLQLKSLLYDLFWKSKDASNGSLHINSTILNNFIDGEDSDIFCSRVREKIFYELVEQKLNHCEIVLRRGPVMDAITPLIFEQISNMIPFLYTANYKESRNLFDLFKEANREEIDFVRADPEQHLNTNAALDKMLEDEYLQIQDIDKQEDFGTTSTHDHEWMMERRDDGSSIPIIGLDSIPWEDDRLDRTSGPWLGLPPKKALKHLVRVFFLASRWLAAVHICQVSWNSKESTISLFHDQLSGALQAWSSGYREDQTRLAEAVIASPLATLGRRLDFRDADQGKIRQLDVDISHYVIANVRWTCDQVLAVFKRVIFVNCDFSSTRFTECKFDGVIFVNCIFDGALFDNCTICDGPNEMLVSADEEDSCFDKVWASRETTLSTPKFRVSAGARMLEQLQHLGGIAVEMDEPATWLYSPSSGIAALPVSEKELRDAASAFAKSVSEQMATVRSAGIALDVLERGCIGTVVAPSHGLAIVGSKLSALTFLSCRFENPPAERNRPFNALTLAYVGGSSVDFVETDELYLSVYGSALRGLSFSRPVEAKPMKKAARFQIDVAESALINTWIGSGIVGEFWANHSTMQSLVSLSRPEDGFQIHAPIAPTPSNPVANNNQSYVDPLPYSEKTTENEKVGNFMVEDLDNIEYKTNYRSRPAKAEYGKLLSGD